MNTDANYPDQPFIRKNRDPYDDFYCVRFYGGVLATPKGLITCAISCAISCAI
jgi:hypothetical protein